jgi:acyl-coenzyme A synthetase/AMP-(fatty) acid ligase
MNSIVKCIYEHSLKQPHKTAVIATDHKVDYSTLWSLISGMASLLKSNGIQKADRIIVEGSHTVEFLVCCYGIHLAGAVHVPIERGTPADRISEISKEIKPKMVLTGMNPISHFGISLMDLLTFNCADHIFPEGDMLQEILFTTGTTGKSKGVMVTHKAQMNMCTSQNAVLNYSKDNMWLIPTPMNHAAALRKTHMSMVKGSSVLLMNGFTNLKKFFENMRTYNVTSLYLPPTGVRYIINLAAKELAKYNDQLDFIYSSSSTLPGGDKDKLIELLPDVRKFDAYGGSEVGAVCYIDYNAIRGDSRCMGKPNPGVEIFIVDENYNRIKSSPEKPGIIAIKSNTVTAGYWNEPELTAKTIQNGVIYMSDLGYIDDNGYLYLVGRRDDVINIGGFKVAPTEVEEVALKLPMIADCACIPYDDKVLGRVVKMFVCLNEGYAFDSEEIVRMLGAQLEAYKVPKYIEAIEAIPRTFNGKIDRKRLLNL